MQYLTVVAKLINVFRILMASGVYFSKSYTVLYDPVHHVQALAIVIGKTKFIPSINQIINLYYNLLWLANSLITLLSCASVCFPSLKALSGSPPAHHIDHILVINCDARQVNVYE